jgi:hypothetical protein
VPFEYPTIEPSLPQQSWQEYWSKKQEMEQGYNNEVNKFLTIISFFEFKAII